MPKIYKQEFVTNNDRAVSVPDINLDANITIDEENLDIETQLSRKLYNSIVEQAQNDAQGISDKILQMANIEHDEILEKARSEAKRMISSAQKQSDDIIKQANEQYDVINEAAKQKGFREGVSEKINALNGFMDKIQKSVDEIKEEHQQYMKKYADELKGLALKISEKLVCSKIDADELVLMNLVKYTMKSIRDAKWVSIEISDKLPKLAEAIVHEIAPNYNDMRVETEMIKNAHKGTCIINLDDKIIDASVMTQLGNIEEYFNSEES